MLSKKKLTSLHHARLHGIGRLLLLARRDFLVRTTRRMELARHPRVSRASGALLPFIDLEGTRSVDLARRLGISKQAVAKAVKELMEQGLVQRVEDGADGRAFLVRFTDSGMEYLLATHDAINQVEAEYEAIVGVEEMRTVRRALALIVYGEHQETP